MPSKVHSEFTSEVSNLVERCRIEGGTLQDGKGSVNSDITNAVAQFKTVMKSLDDKVLREGKSVKMMNALFPTEQEGRWISQLGKMNFDTPNIIKIDGKSHDITSVKNAAKRIVLDGVIALAKVKAQLIQLEETVLSWQQNYHALGLRAVEPAIPQWMHGHLREDVVGILSDYVRGMEPERAKLWTQVKLGTVPEASAPGTPVRSRQVSGSDQTTMNSFTESTTSPLTDPLTEHNESFSRAR